jgi:hypothetical protein
MQKLKNQIIKQLFFDKHFENPSFGSSFYY